MLKNEISIRIDEYRKSNRLNKSELARSVNTDPGNIGAILRGQRSVTVDLIVSFLASFPEVSAEWLLRGEGSMLRPSPSASLSIGGNNNGSASVSAGTGNTTTSEQSTTSQALQIENAVLKEKINALNLIIEEKERIIRIYEKINNK